MKRLTQFERKQELMTAIAEKLKKQDGESVPQPTQPRKGSAIDYSEEDMVVHLQSTTEDIERLSEILLSLIEARR
jgi:acetolactate synthase small subunit